MSMEQALDPITRARSGSSTTMPSRTTNLFPSPMQRDLFLDNSGHMVSDHDSTDDHYIHSSSLFYSFLVDTLGLCPTFDQTISLVILFSLSTVSAPSRRLLPWQQVWRPVAPPRASNRLQKSIRRFIHLSLRTCLSSDPLR